MIAANCQLPYLTAYNLLLLMVQVPLEHVTESGVSADIRLPQGALGQVG